MAKLLKIQNGEILEEIPLGNTELRIGRAADNDVVLQDDTVSSHHAVISLAQPEDGEAASYQIKDLRSTNKTFVNNKEISEKRLNDKDEVRVGLSSFEFDLNDTEIAPKDFDRTTKIHKSWIPGVFYTKD